MTNRPYPAITTTKKLSEFLRSAHLHGLSDAELAILKRLVNAAYVWSRARARSNANNDNGELWRAAHAAVEAFGKPDEIDPHMFCDWQCVATCRGYPACIKHRPAVHCSCGILNAIEWKTCCSCGHALPEKAVKRG